MKGPGGPSDPSKGGRVLDLRAKLDELRQTQAKRNAALEETRPPEELGEKPLDVHADAFSPRPSGIVGTTTSFDAQTDGERGGGVKARLQALGVKGSGLIKSHKTDQTRTIDTPIGKVLEGVVLAETAAGLQRLDGVVKAHEIGLQEPRIKSADLLVLKSLLEVGRFTIEGSPTLQTTDALSSLETGGSVYIGFNAVLQRVVLNLKRVDVLIIEGNPELREIILPKLEVGTRYIHVHDNPNLVRVVIGSREKPAKVASFELQGNALASYPGIFLVP